MLLIGRCFIGTSFQPRKLKFTTSVSAKLLKQVIAAKSDRKSSPTLSSPSTASLSSEPSINVSNEFSSLGLLPDLVSALAAQGISVPTPVQKTVMPRILRKENVVMAASTGSGKTLSYLLPVIQLMLAEEQGGYVVGMTIKGQRMFPTSISVWSLFLISFIYT